MRRVLNVAIVGGWEWRNLRVGGRKPIALRAGENFLIKNNFCVNRRRKIVVIFFEIVYNNMKSNK